MSRETKELVRRMLAEGHEIGNHMVRDEPSIELPAPEFERQLGESHELLSGFAPMRWFRPGSGHYDARMLKALDRRGYRLALGSVYPFDPQIRWSWFSKRFILGNVREGSIVDPARRGGERAAHAQDAEGRAAGAEEARLPGRDAFRARGAARVDHTGAGT
ncbi:MAG: polysaccharide deacetylase family protein [Burkholderiales bacterium]